MPTTITPRVVEKGSCTFVASFTDEDGNAVVPNMLSWTLTDHKGNVINLREDVSLTPASTVNITLSGDDLAIGSNGTKRALLIKATYNSTYGSNLNLRDECLFGLYNTKGES